MENYLRKERINKSRINKGIKPEKVKISCCMNSALQQEDNDLTHLQTSFMELQILLVDVKEPCDFEKEPWETTNIERLEKIPLLKNKGKECFVNRDYLIARQSYEKALTLMEYILKSAEFIEKEIYPDVITKNDLKENPNEIIYLVNGKFNVFSIYTELCNLRLNYTITLLKLSEYNRVITQSTITIKDIIKYKINNNLWLVKAYFRRAKAYRLIGLDLDLSMKDLNEISKLLKSDFLTIVDIKNYQQEFKTEQSELLIKITKNNKREEELYANLFA